MSLCFGNCRFVCLSVCLSVSQSASLIFRDRVVEGPISIWEIRSLGRWAVQVFWFLLGSRNGRRPNPTPDSNPNPNPDPKPQPKRAKTAHKHGCAAFASNQEISQLRTTIPKCRPRYAIFKSKTSLKIPSPRLLNLLTLKQSFGLADTERHDLHEVFFSFSCCFRFDSVQLDRITGGHS